MSRQWARGNQNVQIHTVSSGATISVSFGGTSRRVPLQPAIVPVGANVRSPARLMRARSGVLPFLPPPGLMAGLQAWMTSPKPFSGYLIGGRGGTGKTRLGVELCRAAEQDGWLCGLLEGAAEPAAIEALADVPTTRLVVLDYAESRAEQLEVLLPRLSEKATAEHPVRVLMLVRASPRQDDWSEPLRGRGDRIDAVLDDTEQHVLDNQPLTVPERVALFTATATAFTDRNEPDQAPGTAPVPDPPRELEESLFATPLQVVATAYLAVHGAKEEDLPITREGLLSELLRHEDRYWQSTAGPLGIDKTLRGRVVAVATLAGAYSEAEASQMLQLVPDLVDATAERRGQLARWVRDLYPGPRWWNPLEPDLLGEHLVATHFTECPDVLAGVLQRDEPSALTHPLGLYARIAADRPTFADALQPALTTALPELCRAAVTQSKTHTDLALLLGTTTVATALARAVATVQIDADSLHAAFKDLPQRRDLILGPLELTLIDQLATAHRELAATDPATHEPDLAKSLNNLSVSLAETGRRQEALAAIQEAATVYRRLAAVEPAAYDLELAASLINLSVSLAEAGRRQEDALIAAQDAVSVYRRLAKADPATYEPGLASSLNNLSSRLAETGQSKDALIAAQEAVTIRRRLAEADPAAYEPDYAKSLNSLSSRLAETGQSKDALIAAQEAVTIRRRLAEADPAAYEPDLALSQHTLSNLLAEAGRRPEALSVIEEAVTMRRRLAEAEPAAYEPDLAASLHTLSSMLADAGQYAEADQAKQDADEVQRRRGLG